MYKGMLPQKSHSLGEGERAFYTQYARDFRRALLSHKDSGNSHDKAKAFLQKVFHDLDTDGDGSVSTSELRSFIQAIHTEHGDSSEVDSSKFADILVSQIDVNHDDNVSYREMYEFLWPRVESDREVGVILDLMRENFESCMADKVVRRALEECSDTNDRILIDAFAKHIHMNVLRGNLIEVRALRKAFHKLNGLGVGELSEYEVDTLIESLDTNNDGVVSPREFRAWMFVPSSTVKHGEPQETVTTPVKKTPSISASTPSQLPNLAAVSTPEQIQKAFSAFGEIISERRTALSEMKRANQLRLTDEVKLRTTTEFRNHSEAHTHSHSSVSEALARTAGLAQTNSTPVVRTIPLKGSSARSHPRRSGSNPSSAGEDAQFTQPKTISKESDDPVQRMIFDHKDSEPETPSYSIEEHETTKVISTVMKESVYHEMSEQLKGEKMRVTELSSKINELHALEEEQRQRARTLARERDGLRSDLEASDEEVATLREMCKKQLGQLEHKSDRIIDLEKTLSEYLQRESDLQEELALAGESSEAAIVERDRYLTRMNEAVESLKGMILEVQRTEEKCKSLQQEADSLRENATLSTSSSESSSAEYETRISNLQREFEEMSSSNKSLMIQNETMRSKMSQSHEALQLARDELDTAQCDNEMLKAQFEEMSRANEALIAKNNMLVHDMSKVEAAEVLAREDAEESHKAARNAEASNKQLVATMHEMEKAMRQIEEDRETHVSAHAVLLRQVDKEKVKNRLDSISSGFKMVSLLVLVLGLGLLLIYELAVDFRPCTHDSMRLTS